MSGVKHRGSSGAGLRKGLTETVVDRLEHLVLTELEPGADLPGETDLATQFGVSRLTLREAIKTLQARGLVEIRRGRRPAVAFPNARPIGDFFTTMIRRDPRQLLDLVEVRLGLEVHIAGLAASRATRAGVAALELALESMRLKGSQAEAGANPSGANPSGADPSGADPDSIHADDIRFHQALAAASGNQLLSSLMEAMEDPLHASRVRSLRGHLARGGSVADVIEQHARILARVKARDPKGAEAAMREHLSQTARDLRAAFTMENE